MPAVPVFAAEVLRTAAGEPVAARVLLTRRPALAFDRIDFALFEPVEIAYEFLPRLGQTSDAKLVLSP
ncbi:MAG: hypothetical protein P8R42_29165 [Candidatus Binatia bacterium]|nr:hypothetical protein [Candidatus Binatia bacterium]